MAIGMCMEKVSILELRNMLLALLDVIAEQVLGLHWIR